MACTILGMEKLGWVEERSSGGRENKGSRGRASASPTKSATYSSGLLNTTVGL